MQTETLMEKINNLPIEKVCEVEDFVDFLKEKIARENKNDIFQAIAEYTERHAGSDADLDVELERSAVEFINEENEQ